MSKSLRTIGQRCAAFLLLALPAGPGVAGDLSGSVALAGRSAAAYPGAEQRSSSAIPLFDLHYRDQGYIRYTRAGWWLVQNGDRSLRLGLALDPRMGRSSDADERLRGMDDRRTTLEAGLDVFAITPLGGFDLAALQSPSASDAGLLRLEWFAPLRSDQGAQVLLHASHDWLSAGLADEQFGVRAHEARTDRPAFQAGAARLLKIGIASKWYLSPDWLLAAGVQLEQHGGSATDSPLLQQRRSVTAYAGLGWRF